MSTGPAAYGTSHKIVSSCVPTEPLSVWKRSRSMRGREEPEAREEERHVERDAGLRRDALEAGEEHDREAASTAAPRAAALIFDSDGPARPWT